MKDNVLHRLVEYGGFEYSNEAKRALKERARRAALGFIKHGKRIKNPSSFLKDMLIEAEKALKT